MRGVRLTEIGWEGQCDQCRQWWPLDTESWRPRHGMRRCLACINEERRAYLARLRAENPEMRARHRAASRANERAKRAADPQAFLEYQRRWYAKNHERLMAETAERHAIKAELAGRKVRRSCREETPETLRWRRDFRERWIKRHGPIVSPVAAPDRRYNTDWMRRARAEKKAA